MLTKRRPTPDAYVEADAIQSSPALTALIAEFDRMWGKRVVRTREVIEVVGTLKTT